MKIVETIKMTVSTPKKILDIPLGQTFTGTFRDSESLWLRPANDAGTLIDLINNIMRLHIVTCGPLADTVSKYEPVEVGLIVSYPTKEIK